MFDYIKCEYPLPKEGAPVDGYQTKDLENFMEDYTITKEGRLIHHTVRYEDVPEEERPYYNDPRWDKSPLLQMVGSIRSIPAGDVDMNYTGSVRFYNDPMEFQAIFVEGNLVYIKDLTQELNLTEDDMV